MEANNKNIRIRTELQIRTKIVELMTRQSEQPEQFRDRDEEQKWACLDAQIHALRWVLGEEKRLNTK